MLIPGSAFEREKIDSVKIILRNDKSLKSHHGFYPAEAAPGKPRAQKEYNNMPPNSAAGDYRRLRVNMELPTLQPGFLLVTLNPCSRTHTHTHVCCALHKQKRGLPTG